MLRMETTCGCAESAYTREPILPGAKGEVVVNSTREGIPAL